MRQQFFSVQSLLHASANETPLYTGLANPNNDRRRRRSLISNERTKFGLALRGILDPAASAVQQGLSIFGNALLFKDELST